MVDTTEPSDRGSNKGTAGDLVRGIGELSAKQTATFRNACDEMYRAASIIYCQGRCLEEHPNSPTGIGRREHRVTQSTVQQSHDTAETMRSA